jgi:hypothetical protein
MHPDGKEMDFHGRFSWLTTIPPYLGISDNLWRSFVTPGTFEAADQQLEHAELREAEQWIASSILKDYPNPTRSGCPGLETIKSLAKRAAAFDGFVRDAGWEHVRACSPSYQDFLMVDAIEVVEGYIGRSGPDCGHAHQAGPPTKNGHNFAVHPKPRSHDGIDLAEQYRHGVN